MEFNNKSTIRTPYNTLTYDLGSKVHPILISYIKKIKRLENNLKTIIDIGCGTGRNALYLASMNFEVTAIDNSSKVLTKLKSKLKDVKSKIKINIKQADMAKLPFKNNSFDIAIAWRIFHLGKKEFRKSAIKEMYRVLKPKGYAIVAVTDISDLEKDRKRRPDSSIKNDKNTHTYISKRARQIRHYYSINEIKSGKVFSDFKLINCKVIHEKSGHTERKGLIKTYIALLLQKDKK